MLMNVKRRTVIVYVKAKELPPREPTMTSTMNFIFDDIGPSTQVYRPILMSIAQRVSTSDFSMAMEADFRGSKFIYSYITPILRHQFNIKPREIIARMESKFDIKVSYIKAWDARRKTIQAIFGSYENSSAQNAHKVEIRSIDICTYSCNKPQLYHCHDPVLTYFPYFYLFQASPLIAATHLHMAHEWPVQCPAWYMFFVPLAWIPSVTYSSSV
ncbi:hypothetical protein IEQ34_011232 [Dendrobium chrysotoxum]|uniref:Uncharacterized protein n=1 Tax=Dendrobium chrysotoxum TaxID=161865 RepID=A0AAV7GXP5_DENCH|nr:hypothetical protein IEQ34_011232 [Dendrobium chrysotoxum]